ncbi:MAG TPA: hypothetical protein VIU29_02755 [Candidatus Deferrimicrobiaceae bacterium]
MTEQAARRTYLAAILLGLLFLLPACGGNDGGLFDGLAGSEFWAFDFGAGDYYKVSAREVGNGRYCRVYVEAGRTVPQASIDNIVSQFDNVIYPSVSNTFGSPPNPGIDGDPRITLLILDIRDAVGADGGVTTGYFTAVNEFTQAALAAAGFPDKSNAREMIYLNASFPVPGSPKFFRVVAHELQHMVHFEQKDRRLSVSDDTWLNEAMSESAPLFCGFGPDTDRVDLFARNPSDSLTIWDGKLADYSAVYMWSQYIHDRYPPTLFRTALADNAIGVASISDALAVYSAPNTSTTFAGLFRDWTMANITAADNALMNAVGFLPQWQYTTTLSLASMFTASTDRTNPGLTPPLRQWSADYYQFQRFSPPLAGTVSWSPASGQNSASFFSVNDNTLVLDVPPGSVLPYSGKGYLVVRNESGVDNTTLTPVPITVTPSVILGALMQAPAGAVRRADVAASGEPHVRCGFDRFERRAREIRARGLRVRF